MSRTAAKQTTAFDYLGQEVTIGGLTQTRGAFIAECLEMGMTRAQIDWFLFSHEQGRERRARQESMQIDPAPTVGART